MYEQEDRFRRWMEATGENTIAVAIDVATKPYLADLEAKRRVVEDVPDEILSELSTPYIPLERETISRVGRVDAE